jgi:hypothetical protein
MLAARGSGVRMEGTIVPASRVLRIFRFRLAGPGFDADLRRVVLPDLGALPGVLDVYAGRRNDPNPDERVVVSVWADRESMLESIGPTVERSRFHPELLDLSTHRDLTVCDLAFGDRSPDAGRPAVLRLVAGQVRPGELPAYVREAERGMASDRAAGHGPIAFYLGCTEGDGFRTLSVWPDWPTLQRATGGDLHRPIATRHADRLVAWSADHYEVVTPDAGAGTR